MENELNKDMPELPDSAAPTEADLEAQKWLEDLLASTDPDSLPMAEVLLPEQEANAADSEAVTPSSEEDAPAVEHSPAESDGDEHWFQQLEAPSEQAPLIGTDEHAVSAHEMTDMADMELEKIMQEAMNEEWDLASIEHEILSEPIEDIFPEKSITDESGDLYTDGGQNPQEDGEPERKVRPKRKKGYGLFGLPHLVSTAIWAAICIGIGITLGNLIWVCAADVLAFGRPDKDVQITITAEDTLDTITEKLHRAGLIEYPELFKLYANLTKVEEKDKISQGTFTLNTMYDYHAIVGGMSSSSSYRSTTEVVIPEGYTCAQIFAKLEEAGVCSVAELEKYCEENEFSSYWFLKDVEKGTKYCLEGFLYPNTYQFYIDSTAKEVFIKMLGGFEDQFDDEMVAQLEVLNEQLKAMFKANGVSDKFVPMTVHDVVIVASIIEKESAYSGESPTIASVFYNRLTDPNNYPYLNSDATVIYAHGGSAENLDYGLDSPYNTYVSKGLPPGAISNPGEYSLKAALFPAQTNYHFFILDPTAEITSHRFFATYKEHEDFLDSLR